MRGPIWSVPWLSSRGSSAPIDVTGDPPDRRCRCNDDQSGEEDEQHVVVRWEPITIQRLIGYWGYESRGKNRVQTIYRDLAKMGLRTNPPFDGGHLDLEVLIERDSPEQVVLAVSEQPADHLLTLSRIDSAMYALRLRDQGAVRGFVTRETLVSDALTLMMRHDFSQLPGVESLDRPAVVGISPGSRSGSRRCGVRVPPLSAK